MNTNYKSLLVSISLLLMLSVISACGSGNGNSSSSQNNNSDDSLNDIEQTDNSGDEKIFTFGRGADSISLDPSIVMDGDSFYAALQIFDGLVNYKEGTTEIEPGLATEWKANDDATIWTFKLREDVQFHDGNTFDAEDVIYNFERWASSGEFAFYGSIFKASESNLKGIVDEVKAINDYEVEFILSEPNAMFAKSLAITAFGISSPQAIEKYGDDYFKNPVGTGPFIFESWKTDDRITMKKNENYYGDVPKYDKLVFRVVPDNSSRFVELQSGELDLMDSLNPEDLDKVESDDSLQVVTRPPGNVGYMAMNMKHEALSKKEVREAINLAIDVDGLMALFQGLGEKAINPIPPIFDAFNDDIEDYGYDVEKAKKLLNDAGYESLDLTLYTFSSPRIYMPQPKITAQAIQEMLGQVDINIEIIESDFDTYKDSVQNGDHDLAFHGFANADPSGFFDFLLAKGSIDNIAYFESDEVDELVKKAKTELDEEKRIDYYKEAQQIVHDEIPWVFIANVSPPMAAKKELIDYKPIPVGSEKFNKLDF